MSRGWIEAAEKSYNSSIECIIRSFAAQSYGPVMTAQMLDCDWSTLKRFLTKRNLAVDWPSRSESKKKFYLLNPSVREVLAERSRGNSHGASATSLRSRALRAGVNYNTVKSRKANGWSSEEALMTPRLRVKPTPEGFESPSI